MSADYGTEGLDAQPPIRDPLGSHDGQQLVGRRARWCDYQFAGNWVIGIKETMLDRRNRLALRVVVAPPIARASDRSPRDRRIGLAGSVLGYVKGGAGGSATTTTTSAPRKQFFAAASEPRGWTVAWRRIRVHNYLTGFVDTLLRLCNARSRFSTWWADSTYQHSRTQSVIRGGLNFPLGYGPVIANN